MSMTDLLIQTSPGSNEKFRGFLDICRSSVIPRYSLDDKSPPQVNLGDLKHSKSDDLVLQSAPISEPEMKHGISDATMEIQKEACVVYEEDIMKPMSSLSSNILPSYYSDSEANVKSPDEIKSVLKITGDFGSDAPPSRRTSQRFSIYDRIDPEDSIRDIVSENDFYRFVLFKRHYEKYMDISRKYEEARNLAYYLEEKYHEIKTERENLIAAHKALERNLEARDIELHEKEEEMFLQLEKAVRLEEDCEKLRAEKDKMEEWKNRLQRERDEAYKQLRLQADSSEVTRRRLERARHDVVQQVTAIVAEKDVLERENIRLKEALQDVERRYPIRSGDKRAGKTGSVLGLEKEVQDLKLMAKQSATLNSQLKKGMKHLATCRRRKCCVCSYTKATFGEYASSSDEIGRGKLISGCFPFHDLRRKVRHENGDSHPSDMFTDLAERLSQCSFQPSAPSASSSQHQPSQPYSHSPPLHLSYIDDDCSSGSDADIEEDEAQQCRISTASSSLPPHAFSSDSGFSSELCDSNLSQHRGKSSLQRATRWTSSFRKLIRRVSSAKRPSASNQHAGCHNNSYNS
ncbi:hypothetical protein M8J76_007781 [Diaphorina citri]|nr:hypothetical protein M8J76_007781 [Diaphorina citri]